MSSFAMTQALEKIDDKRFEKARDAFLSVPKSFTIRRGVVTGKDQLDERLRRAIAAYEAGSGV